VFERLRRGWSLPVSLVRLIRGAWMSVAVAGLAVVVLTGHYGGTLVYDHAVGTVRAATPASNAVPATPPVPASAQGDDDN
jgi:hypothetical protein